jgi:hypothetical protein
MENSFKAVPSGMDAFSTACHDAAATISAAISVDRPAIYAASATGLGALATEIYVPPFAQACDTVLRVGAKGAECDFTADGSATAAAKATAVAWDNS